jgi:phosphoenolpyruvate carboxykinase (ATP)
MESSAGDPTQAGKLKSVFFYDPFIAGSREYHARRFYEILKGLPHINCYVINTAGVGEGESYKDISLEHTMNIMDSLVRGGLEDWVVSPVGLRVPTSIRNVDSIYVHPEELYSEEGLEFRKKELWHMVREAVEGVGGSLRYELQRALNSDLRG